MIDVQNVNYIHISVNNLCLKIMNGNRKLSSAAPRPLYQYENDLVEENEDDDLYEPPPSDLQSRTLPCVWTAQENHSTYLGPPHPLQKSSAKTAPPHPLQKPPIPEWNQQGHRQQKPLPKQTRPAPPAKRGPPLPPPDRRMSLPCTVMRSPPNCNNNFPQGKDDMYLTILETQVNMHNDVATGGDGKNRQRTEDLGVLGRPWYGGEMERRETERALRRINKDGCYLVRLSSSQNQTQPYTLAVLYNDHIYNIPIRAVANHGFSLGKEGKRHEEVFPSVVHLIEHYQHEPLNLVNRQTSERECTALLYPAVL
ncbi:SH2 domain-containing protein 6 isoform X2 [Hyla sarda]|uniref:SH2 domain-containing protein 6 isoform X2 n=1 Tax=Hyla sarda TaxID=327740 RepID=UPI0024C2AF38|nr:SH2 domain-containing protein 6 isoform X2 [Hyla sarda]